MRNISRNLLLLERIASGPPATQSELAASANLSRSTASDVLRDLQALGYVTLRNRTYHPGLRLLTFVMRAREAPSLAVAVHAVLETLAEQTGETAICAIPITGRGNKGLQVMAIDEVQSRHQLRYVAQIGQLYLARERTTGQVILAHQPDTESLSRELVTQIRSQGYGMTLSDPRGATIVAAPVLTSDGDPLAAISVIGPAERMPTPEKDVLPHLRSAILRLSDISDIDAHQSV